MKLSRVGFGPALRNAWTATFAPMNDSSEVKENSFLPVCFSIAAWYSCTIGSERLVGGGTTVATITPAPSLPSSFASGLAPGNELLAICAETPDLRADFTKSALAL